MKNIFHILIIALAWPNLILMPNPKFWKYILGDQGIEWKGVNGNWEEVSYRERKGIYLYSREVRSEAQLCIFSYLDQEVSFLGWELSSKISLFIFLWEIIELKYWFVTTFFYVPWCGLGYVWGNRCCMGNVQICHLSWVWWCSYIFILQSLRAEW